MVKKLLLASLIFALGFSAQADVVAFVADGATYDGEGTTVTLPEGPILTKADDGTYVGTVFTAENVCSFQWEKKNNSVSQVTSKLLRWYANDVLHITPLNGVTINKVTFKNSQSSGSPTFTISPDDCGSAVYADKIFTWTGAAAEDFSIAPSAQVRAAFIEVDYTVAGSSDLKPADLSFGEQTSFSVDLGQEFTAPALINPNGLAVCYSSDNEEVATVDAATGAVTIKSFGSAKITAESAETSEFKAGKASYTLTVVAVANTIAEIYELGADTKTVVKVNFPLVVTYRNKSNCYVRNEANGEVSLIFGDTNYQRGDVIPAGWTCTYSPFNGLPELKPAVGMPETDGTSTVSFDTKTLAEINDLKYANGIYYVRDVTFADATKVSTNDSNERNFTGEQNEVDYNFRANFFGVPSVEAGTYNVLHVL